MTVSTEVWQGLFFVNDDVDGGYWVSVTYPELNNSQRYYYGLMNAIGLQYNTSQYWEAAIEGFTAINATRSSPIGVTDANIAMYMVMDYDNALPVLPPADPDAPIPMDPEGPINDDESTPWLDPAYLDNSAYLTTASSYVVTSILSNPASFTASASNSTMQPAVKANATSSTAPASSVTNSASVVRPVTLDETDDGLGDYGEDDSQDGYPQNSFTNTDSGYSFSNATTPIDGGTVTEVVVTLAQPGPISIDSTPGLITLISPITVDTFPARNNVALYTSVTPQYLQNLNIRYIPPITPNQVQHIYDMHGPAAYSLKKTMFYGNWLTAAGMNALMWLAVSNGRLVGEMDSRGYQAILYTAPAPVGTNRFGDTTNDVRVVLGPVNAATGLYGVVTMYPALTER